MIKPFRYLLLTIVLFLFFGCEPQLYLPGQVTEGEGVLPESGFIQLPWAIPGKIITLESSDSRVVIPRLVETDNSTLVSFSINIKGNNVEDAENTVLVRVTVPGFSILQGEIEVFDDEDPAFVPLEDE